MAGMTLIVRTVSRLLFPFMFLFGIYVTVHGHLSLGGGFVGGVIIAASVLMLLLAHGIKHAQAKVGTLQAELAVSLGGLSLVGLGLLGFIIGFAFFLPHGTLGQLFSAGEFPLLNIGFCVMTAGALVTIFYATTIRPASPQPPPQHAGKRRLR